MHADNNTPQAPNGNAYKIGQDYYLGMIDEKNQILFYVWFGNGWAFVNPDPQTWNGQIYTFCRMNQKVALETIAEIRDYISPYKKTSILYRDYSRARLFLIPAIDGFSIWGFSAGAKE